MEANEEMIREYKAIKGKDDPGREHVKPVSHNVSMLNHSESEPMEMLKDVLCQVGVTTTVGTHDDEAGSSRPKRTRQSETVEVAMLLCVYHEILLWGTNDELRTKKVIKFRLRGSGHTLTLLEFARRLVLYHEDEVNDGGFEVHFQGGLRSDENFNARDYWLSISSKDGLHLSQSLASTIRHPILRVLQKMITYGFITRIAKRMGLLTDEVLNSLSAPTYCRELDATTLKDLIGPDGRLIVEDPAPGVPRVAMPRVPCPSMQDLYDRMGNMKIRQGTLKRGWPVDSYTILIGILDFLSTWLGTMDTHCGEPMHHQGMMRSSWRIRSGVEMTRTKDQEKDLKRKKYPSNTLMGIKDASRRELKEEFDKKNPTDSGKKKEAKAFTFYLMETEDISERYDAPCFVNGLEAYDGEINLEHNGDKVVKKELIVALRGEIYFVKFIINPEEDDIEPGVVLGRSFLRLTKGIADFGNRIITSYPDPKFSNVDDSDKANDSEDDWDVILEGIDFEEIPKINGLELPSYVCNMRKSSKNKKKPTKNYKMKYDDEGPSLTVNRVLTREEISREELEKGLWERIVILNEPRPIIETLKYGDRYIKVLDTILLDKLKLDGELELEEVEANEEC
ncbi:hypothetical protein Tco_0877414 [Tanacetum coccineum]|uniref:Uncharacterized protein n=1 Tax=Tanacetum coccineum TaxID=301880 RepID=A0ABQ5BYG8_9ASTR